MNYDEKIKKIKRLQRRKYYLENREKLLLYYKKWYAENREKRLKYLAAWRAAKKHKKQHSETEK
jgi:hypothetical protein